MTWEQFRARVIETFGPGLERTTPDGVHGFCALVREEAFPSLRDGDAWVLDCEPATDLESVMSGYFESVLRHSPDAAAISLWLHAFETWYATRDDDAARFLGLIDGLGEACD